MVTPSLLVCSSLAALVCARAPLPSLMALKLSPKTRPMRCRISISRRLGGLGISCLAREVMAHASAGSQATGSR